LSLKLYNTISRKKEEFIPSEKNIVKIYVCGPTVYNYISIGNARPIIVFNMVRNYLKFLGYKVIFVQNITDIEDKIINKASAEGVDFKVITDRYIKAFLEDINTLEISSIDEMPLATKMIDEIIDIINRIIKNGYGYAVNGNVYFDVSEYKNYGKLSGQKIDEMKDTDENDFEKQDKIDFALWKEAKPGEPSWESPWGKGRPGWHIECSAMSIKYLGFGFDIHGGGLDLIFPHHENEIAQSEAAFPDKGNFVKYWMHNGMIEVKDRKMSKSDGLKEDWILKNLLKKYSPDIIKFYMLSTHYRSPLEFSIEKLEESKKAFEKIINTIRNIKFIINNNENKKVSEITFENNNKLAADKTKLKSFLMTVKKDFISAMNDDFNSAGAIGILFEAIKNINGIIQSSDFVSDDEIISDLKSFYGEITDLYNIFGINLNKELKDDLLVLQTQNMSLDVEKIENLIKERNEARKNKDFKKSDEIRNKLLNEGIILEDRKEGTIWKVQK
jgi:cysteinyl-tRNA synthetase